MSQQIRDWLKRCITRRFFIVFELGTMAAIGAVVAAMLR